MHRVLARVRACPWEKRLEFGVVILLGWCLIALFGTGELRGNEFDVLPAAKQYVEHTWLPSDWYLNLPIAYRRAFNVPVGLALKFWSFQTVAIAGRALVFASFSAACVAMCRAFRVDVWLCVPWILLYLPAQSLVAGEWIIQSLETKPFAYVSAMVALTCLLRRRYASMAAWLGLAVTMHLLIGLSATLCSVSCLLLPEQRRAWSSVHRWALAGLVTAGSGLAAIVEHGSASRRHSPALIARGAEIYVKFRVPHHLLPDSWAGHAWLGKLGLCLLLFALLRTLRDERYRLLAQYALSASALFVVGLALAYWGPTALLRLYWFRFADTMLPLLGWLGLAMLMTDAWRRAKLRSWRAVRGLAMVVTLTAPLVCSLPYLVVLPVRAFGQDLSTRHFRAKRVAHSAMNQWIREHTEPHARFLIDPASEKFYVEAERAVLVMFKQAPQSEAEIVEWFARLQRLNGNRSPRASGYAAMREISDAYRNMSTAQISALARDYDLTYLVSEAPDLPFPKLHQDAGSTLYGLTIE